MINNHILMFSHRPTVTGCAFKKKFCYWFCYLLVSIEPFNQFFALLILFSVPPQVPDQYGTIRAVAEGKGEQFLVGTSRNFILRGTFNDGFQVEVQVRRGITGFFFFNMKM